MEISRVATSLMCLLLISILPAGARAAPPSCEKYYEPGAPGEKLLSCKFRGGTRPTRELGGQKYLNVVGTCYDYDLVSLKKCGCRMFEKASLCCGKGSAAKTCNWQVGNSRWVDCGDYKQPKYGLAGDKPTEACRQELNAADCFKRVSSQILTKAGPCDLLRASCKGDREQSGKDFFNMRCGPLLSDCGCELDRDCTPADGVACYDEYSQDEEAIACFWQKDKSQYDREQCFEAVKQKRGKP